MFHAYDKSNSSKVPICWKRVQSGEISGSSSSSHIGIACRINRDASALISSAATKVSRIKQNSAIRTYLSRESVTSTAKFRLQSARRGGEIARACSSGYISIGSSIECNTSAQAITLGTSERDRIDQCVSF